MFLGLAMLTAISDKLNKIEDTFLESAKSFELFYCVILQYAQYMCKLRSLNIFLASITLFSCIV